MSGLLRWLSSRARIGMTVTVHPMARIPFVAPLELKDPEAVRWVETTESPAAAEPRSEPRERSAPAERSPSRAAVRHDVPSRRAPGRRRFLDANEPPPDGHFEGREPPSHGDDVESRGQMREGRIPEEIVPRAGRDIGSLPRSRAAVDAAEPTEVRVLRHDAPPGEHVASRRPSVTRPTSLPRPAAEPRPVRSPSASTDLRTGAHPPVEDREPTEVHVHIGRIEVTAVREPAPAKRGREPERKPMTLDEYLDRRRRRSS